MVGGLLNNSESFIERGFCEIALCRLLEEGYVIERGSDGSYRRVYKKYSWVHSCGHQ